MPKPPPLSALTRRESQIMEILYRRGQATAAEVHAEIPEPPSYSTARKLLEILEEKGYVRHEQDGPRYLYLPTVPRESARVSALSHMVRTFFGGSTEAAVAALLDESRNKLSDAELDRIAGLIDDARTQGR
jgi:BlaI family transcriptional regulator, penicillinase repressor